MTLANQDLVVELSERIGHLAKRVTVVERHLEDLLIRCYPDGGRPIYPVEEEKE